MSTRRNVLFISPSFPPRLDAESLQSRKIYKYLSNNNKFNIKLVRSSSINSISGFFSPNVHDDGGDIVVDIYRNRFFDYFKTKILPEVFMKPDLDAQIVRAWKKLVQVIDEKPDIIISRAFPMSSSILAKKLSEYYDIPWVSQMSDPWGLSSLPSDRRPEKWVLEQEEELLRKATYLTFTSKITLDKYSKKYSKYKNKMRYVPNVYDEELVNRSKWKKESLITISMTGTMSDDRNPINLITYARRFFGVNPEKKKDFRILMAGFASRNVRRILSDNSDIVDYLGVCNFEESISIQKNSDVLLIIDNNKFLGMHELNSRYEFFPSKVIDYLSVGRPIMAMTHLNSNTDDLVKSYEAGFSFRHDDYEEFEAAMNSVWVNWKAGDSNYFDRHHDIGFFSAKHQSEVISGLIEKALHNA